MVTSKLFTQIALSLPEVAELPHFEKTSFRVSKKVFATLDINNSQACIKLSEIDQHVFSTVNAAVIFPVPNKWGKQGWTMVRLEAIKEDILRDVVRTAYCAVAASRLVSLLQATNSTNAVNEA